MKTKISRIGKKSLSVIIALMMIVSTMLVGMVSASAASETFVAKSTIYIDIGKTWYGSVTDTNVNATIYANYCYSNGDSDINSPVSKEKLTQVSGSIYTGTIPENAYIRCIKVDRRNSNGTTTWNSFKVLASSRSNDSNNLATFTQSGEDWSNGSVAWSNYSGGSSTVTKYYYSYYDGSNNQYKEMTNNNGVYTFEPSSLQLGNTNGVAKFKITTSSDTSKDPANSKELCVNKNNPEVTRSTAMETAGITVQLNNDQYNDVQISNKTKEYVITFTPNSSNPLTGTINVDLKSSTPTPTTTYYLGGRIKQDDSDTWCTYENKSYPFDETETPGLYKYVSNQTAKAWSGTRGQSNLLQYFFVHKGISKDWYGCSDTDGVAAALTTANQSVSLTNYTSDNDTKEARLTYINSTDDTGNVIFYLDTNNGMKLYYEVEGGSTTKGAFEIKDKTAVNGSLSFSAEGKTAGTADAGNTVNVTAKPYAGFTCSGITVSYTNKTTSETVTLDSTGSGNNYSFVVPDELTTAITESISVAATFTLDKSAYIATKGDGLWIDVAPNENDSTATLIKWNNYSGNNQDTNTNPYTFYVPKNVVLANATVYNGFDSEVKLNGVSIPANSCNTETLSLTAGTTYNKDNDNTYTVKVMQGSTNAMFLYTTKGDAAYSLPTKTGAGETKDSVKSDGGSCKTMTDTTDTAKQFSAAMALDSVKGRGNSSWEASNKLFGKYAFNMKLGSKTKLFGMDNAKSWCLLANNADESMLRNALTYQLAAEIGIQDSPEFRFVDIYDNGEYLGSYLVTEKVDVGNSKLVKGESFDEINEKAANKNVDEGTKRGTYTYNDTQYNMQYTNVLPSGSNTSTIDYDKKGKYLLEFELKKRLLPPDGDESRTASEASWFRSPKGQYVVVKSPEFATKEQVEFIATKFAAMEAKVFTANAAKSDLSTVMDVESFAKMYLIQEFSSNLDSAATSYYMTFDCAQTNPVFVANPVWDYDWAYGQYEKQVKEDVNGTRLDSANPKAWFAKSKQIGDNEADGDNKYSIQSQLASNSDSFKSVVRKVWEQEKGFYDNIKKYYGDNSQIDAWYNQIKDSVDMNETRWGFIASDPLIKGESGTGRDSWGSKNTGANHAEAVNYLENTWTKVRAEEFLNTESGLLNSEYAPYTPAKPAISAYNADLSATITSPINAGTDFVIKVTSEIESGVKYRLYEGSSSAYLYENKDGVFSLKATKAGKKTYTVKAVFGENESSASDSVEVTVVALDITDVTLESSKSTVKPGDTFTLTATATPGGLSGVTYTFYQSSDSTVSNDDTRLTSSDNKATVTADSTPGSYYYYVVATDANSNSKTSSIVTVNVTNEGAVINNVKIRFKGTTLSSLIPYMSVDGEAATVMSRSTANPIGTHLSGAYRFVWFEATIPTVTVGQGKTLTFTTNNSKESTMVASITLDFTTCDAENVIYLAVDNLMSGTTAVDITNNETAKTTFGSAMNMIKQSSASDPVATTLLSTMLKVTSASGKVTTKRYYLGDLDSDNKIGIKDATEIQKSIAGTSELGAEYQSLGDFNADGVVDIKDATAIQKYIAGF